MIRKIGNNFTVAAFAICVVLTVTTVVGGSIANAKDVDLGSEGNGTLPARWYGYVQIDDTGTTRPATMVLKYVDDMGFVPEQVGCSEFGQTAGEGYVTAGWIKVSDINKFFAISAICLSSDDSLAELVAVDTHGVQLHLRGDLANKKFGMMFSGSFQSGSRFVFVEDRRPHN